MRAFSVAILFACGCSGGGSDPPTDAPISETGCVLLWRVTETGGVASIADGELTLSTESVSTGVAVEVKQRDFSGMFVATFTVTAWTAGGTGAYVQLHVADDDGNVPPRNVLTARLGTSPLVGVRATAPGITDEKPTTATTGTLTVERKMGAAATEGVTILTAMTSDATATVSYTRHAPPAATVALQIGTDGGPIGATSAKVSELVVTTTGRGAGDTFDCDSLLRE